MATLRIDPTKITQINCLEFDGALSCIHLFFENGESLYIGASSVNGNGFAIGFNGEPVHDNGPDTLKQLLERGICSIAEF